MNNVSLIDGHIDRDEDFEEETLMTLKQKTIDKRNRQKAADRVTLVNSIAFCASMEDDGLSINRIKRILERASVKAIEITDELVSNKFHDNEHDKWQYDADYNRDLLRRMAERYGIYYDESIFDEIRIKKVRR